MFKVKSQAMYQLEKPSLKLHYVYNISKLFGISV